MRQLANQDINLSAPSPLAVAELTFLAPYLSHDPARHRIPAPCNSGVLLRPKCMLR
jgi:hypothetical protein